MGRIQTIVSLVLFFLLISGLYLVSGSTEPSEPVSDDPLRQKTEDQRYLRDMRDTILELGAAINHSMPGTTRRLPVDFDGTWTVRDAEDEVLFTTIFRHTLLPPDSTWVTVRSQRMVVTHATESFDSGYRITYNVTSLKQDIRPGGPTPVENPQEIVVEGRENYTLIGFR